MPRQELTLGTDADAITRLVRMLDASVNVELLRVLSEERRANKEEGWLFLSDVAKRVGQSPGAASVAIQKMVPALVEERYERGKRYFRARVTSLKMVLDGPGFDGA